MRTKNGIRPILKGEIGVGVMLGAGTTNTVLALIVVWVGKNLLCLGWVGQVLARVGEIAISAFD